MHPYLVEMRINLKEGVCLIRKRPYSMNPNLHIKLKEEIDKIFESGIINPIDDFEWVSPMVISIKKDVRIRICVDYRELNIACVIYPFPTPFI